LRAILEVYSRLITAEVTVWWTIAQVNKVIEAWEAVIRHTLLLCSTEDEPNIMEKVFKNYTKLLKSHPHKLMVN